jgi:choline-sulfatase
MTPNILLIVSDQHRADAMGCAGHPIVRTPHLDRLAAEGARFETTYSQSPLCLPSRASFMTGRFPHTCRAFTHRHYDLPEIPTIASHLRAAGYRTGGFGKMHIHGETRERDLGFDERGMRLYTYNFADYREVVGQEGVLKYARYMDPKLARFQETYNPTNAPVDLPDELLFDHLVVDKSLEFLSRQSAEQPFFLYAGIEKPHSDWFAPQRFHDLYDPAKMPLPPTLNESREDMPSEWWSSTRQSHCFYGDEIAHCIAAYYANVTYADEQIGRLLDALDRSGQADNTLVIYTSDHGEMLFEHGMVQKHNFFEGSVRVPMIVRQPGTILAGSVRHDTASLLDLFPTICDATELTPPAGLEGRSLLSPPPDADIPAFSEFYTWGFPERMIRLGRWKYIHSEGRICQLYDLETDPQESHNLINDPDFADILASLRQRVLDGWEFPPQEVLAPGKPWNTVEDYRAARS